MSAAGPKTAKAKATRERLLREACQLFSVKGYAATRVEEVMARAGLTKGGFYAHFDSKEELARAVIDHATGLWVTSVITKIMTVAGPREQLHALLDAYRQYATGRTFEGGCFFVNLAVEMDDQHEAFRAVLDLRFEQFRALVRGIVERGKAEGAFVPEAPSDAIATLVVACLTGTMMLAKSSRSWDRFDESVPLLAHLLASYEIPPRPSPSAAAATNAR